MFAETKCITGTNVVSRCRNFWDILKLALEPAMLASININEGGSNIKISQYHSTSATSPRHAIYCDMIKIDR